jgi:DNA polymerase III subunit gamma/tau
MNDSTQLDKKYRPRTLEKVIGHETAVQRLQGIIESKKYPHALLLVGPSSVGKTTLARAFVASLFGVKTLEGNPDFHELNSADSRGIDDMRSMLKVARLRPRAAPRRVFLFDEAHGFTGDAANLLLKPLEEPPAGTMFILGSMEPEKLKPAIKNRCQQFVLKTPTTVEMTKYIKRVAKGEDMKYMSADFIKTVVDNSNGEMRSAAALMQALDQMAAGKKTLSVEDIGKALDSAETNDDAVAVEVLASVYQRKLSSLYRNLLNVESGFQFVTKLLNLNRFLINNMVLKGEKHKSVWFSKVNSEMHASVKRIFSEANVEGKALALLTIVQNELVDLKREAGTFQVNEVDAIGYRLSHAIARLTPMMKDKS